MSELRPEHRIEFWDVQREQLEKKLAHTVLTIDRFETMLSGQLAFDFRNNGLEL